MLHRAGTFLQEVTFHRAADWVRLPSRDGPFPRAVNGAWRPKSSPRFELSTAARPDGGSRFRSELHPRSRTPPDGAGSANAAPACPWSAFGLRQSAPSRVRSFPDSPVPVGNSLCSPDALQESTPSAVRAPRSGACPGFDLTVLVLGMVMRGCLAPILEGIRGAILAVGCDVVAQRCFR